MTVELRILIMATYSLEDNKELSCPICFEDYDIQDARRMPKLLLCLHTFCSDCTQKLWKNDRSLECSLCRMIHEDITLEDIFDNHVIIQHLRLVASLCSHLHTTFLCFICTAANRICYLSILHVVIYLLTLCRLEN